MRLLVLVAYGLLLACGPAAAAAADAIGVWLVEDQSGQIEIANCGGLLWGIVVWERTPGRDTENPDAALRGRPTLGIPILLGMRPVVQQGSVAGPQMAAAPPTVWRGQIYNSRNGQTYEVSLKPLSPDALHLEGCVLGGLFCGGQNWTRVKAPASGNVCSRVSDLARGSH